jgi:hypothetical protein
MRNKFITVRKNKEGTKIEIPHNIKDEKAK